LSEDDDEPMAMASQGDGVKSICETTKHGAISAAMRQERNSMMMPGSDIQRQRQQQQQQQQHNGNRNVAAVDVASGAVAATTADAGTGKRFVVCL